MKNSPENFESGISGAGPVEWYGVDLPDGDRAPWATAPVGSIYVQKSATAQKNFTKVKTSLRDDDWVQRTHCISVTVAFNQFTDGGGASGTYDLVEKIPVGAWVMQAKLVNVIGFAGNTSAVVIVGESGDTDRYNTGTPSVFTTAAAIDLGVPSGTKIHTAETTIRITVTGGSDFTAISAGQLTLQLYYLN